MQDFVNIHRVNPDKAKIEKRIHNYKEIYAIYKSSQASAQSSRCVQCGIPYCHNSCPLGNYIPFWLKFVADGDYEKAFNLSNSTNPFPEITGRVCPKDILCEKSCILNTKYKAVSIGDIETFISERGFKNNLKPIYPKDKIDKSVAIIGSGPAGLSAASYLLKNKIKVTMYEKSDKPGGLLTYGIPSFKLEKDIVFRRYDWLLEGGLKLHLNTVVGKDIEFDKILKAHEAIFLGIGAKKSKRLNFMKDDIGGVFTAIDFLENIQKKLFNDRFDLKYNVKDKAVVVIGGGDTAMDCVRTSIREGAKTVKCLYRRDLESMPGSKREFDNALEEGVVFKFCTSPKEPILNNSGKLVGIKMQKTVLKGKDNSGRVKCFLINGSDYIVNCDVLIIAIGFDTQKFDYLSEANVEFDKYDRVIVDKNFLTSNSKIFAGGDCQRGSHLVVTAAQDAKIASYHMLRSVLGAKN